MVKQDLIEAQDKVRNIEISKANEEQDVGKHE